MKDTESTPKINPKIKEKTIELFDLIEEQFIKDNKTCETGENMYEEMGEILRSHIGMEELRFAYQISRTKSQEAEFGLEESLRYMRNDTLEKVHNLSRYTSEIIEVLEGDRPQSHIDWRVKELKQLVPEFLKHTVLEYQIRTTSYNDEINKLKGVN